MEVAILTLSILVSVGTGLFVVARNYQNIVNRIYGLLAISLVLFSLTNYLSLRTVDRLFYIRAVIFFATIAVACLYYLIVFQSGKHTLNRLQRLGLFFSVLVAGLDFTPLVFSGLREGASPVPIPNFGAIVFGAQLIIFLGASFVSLVNRVIHAKGVERLQYAYMLVGVLPMFALAPVTGVVLPVVLQNDKLIFLSPAYGAFFVCLVGYAIVKHRLFDIRLAIARSIAYILSLGSIGLIYGIFIIALSSLSIFNEQPLDMQRVEYVAFALLTALLYPYIKKFFAKATDRVLYQDAYDAQAFLDQLNQTLVSNIELEKLLKECSQIIANNLKAEYCLFGIKETGIKGIRTIGTIKKEFDVKDIVMARHLTPHLGTNVVIADYLPPEAEKFKQLLIKNDVEALVRLVPEFASTKDGVEGLGYIILGQKRSGNMYTSEDVRILGIIANELVIAIQNALHFEEIQRFNITLQERIDRATRELRRTNQKLRELDETKDDFISMASHQLRTPLTSVKGYLSMVLEGDAGKLNATQIKMLNQAFSSSQRMVYLITDLLNVSRLKTGKFVINAAPMDLSQVAQEEISQLVETAQARHVELKYDKPEHFPLLMLDETKMRQVIMNFIDNAIYYTPSGGHIRVELMELPETVELKVIDDGIGVPKSEQHHLFTKFYRAGNARKARPDGTGLGLFMAKKVITAQGGSTIFSSKEGQGSTFGFVFSKNRLKIPTLQASNNTTEIANKENTSKIPSRT